MSILGRCAHGNFTVFLSIVSHRPDIVYSQVSRFLTGLNSETTVIRISRNVIKNLVKFRLLVILMLTADYGGCLETKKSTSDGCIFTMANGVITRSSRIETIVALSITEVKYFTLA